ncbi:Fur family transcriptional regulator [Peptoniphilus raoultii]|uniref:Fur family transcriptional regulator n=1 Tax=Peptoniphilus raoultii TaxID=1776387 RepID=UPI0008DAFBD0|nr:Fur family transcriptional regulator [Peptoniphilus raoultii]
MNKYQKLLKEHNLILTKGRLHALEVLSKEEIPLNVEEIFAKVDKEFVPNFTSLYRILNQLYDAGLLNKTIYQDGINYYEFKRHDHRHYIICTKCGKVSKIKGCPMDAFEEEVSNDTGFIVKGHTVELEGICPDCQKNDNK